ncbi:unnamed protein product [Brassicogethes aeneus]|uniref:PX domain-containing protein kinase-like protein n=1 Tax=Brassicogethes aeneus TaxID=1431903 RepID=A0A9P0AY99_BRAAE|nr:unnamed protein product [Brassicogethes aeneus]
MAIFEQQTVNKVLLDDTEPLTCVIENWRNVNGHTEFVLRVHRGPFSDKTWRVSKRYNDFHKLHSYLQTSGIPLEFPPKKLIGNMEPHFISERQQSLQKYLNAVLMNPILVSSLPARSFVDPANYCQPFGELALQHVSLALRGEVGWEVSGPLTEIGWRLRKHYYQVRLKSMPKVEFLGGWTDYGPDKHLDDKDMHAVFKCLSQLQHPYIQPIELCLCTDVGGLAIRKSLKGGSVRDALCQSKPQQSFLKKYGNPKGHKPLGVELVKLYGRQILEALKFLHEKGLPYGHLHTGNVFIEENNLRIRLTDIENGVLGVPSFYRPYFMQHRKINTMEAIDVYCFGHTIYEMSFGAPLHESTAEQSAFNEACEPLKRLLDSILSAEALKQGLPSIEQLLNHEFFKCTGQTSAQQATAASQKCHLKIGSSTKERLKHAIKLIEDRLTDEQKMVRSQKRLVKVQEMMSSEEEKKKQRNKLKQERHIAKERQRSMKEHRQESMEKTNGGERSDSVNSSAATSVGTSTPPSASSVPATTTANNTTAAPVAAPPPPPPPTMAAAAAATSPPPANGVGKERTALLGAICNFNKSALRKTKVPTN